MRHKLLIQYSTRLNEKDWGLTPQDMPLNVGRARYNGNLNVPVISIG